MTGNRSGAKRLLSNLCPNCGAPLDLSGVAPDQTHIQCQYCGSSAALPQRGKPAPPTTRITVIESNQPEQAEQPSAQSKGCASALAFVTGILILGVAVLIALIEAGLLAPLLTNLPTLFLPAPVFGAPYLMPRQNDGPQQILYMSAADRQTFAVSYEPAARRENWRSPLFNASFTDMTLAADDERAYIAHGDALTALNRSDGSVAWEIALAFGISPPHACAGGACLQAFGNHVVARLKDGTLMALDGPGGRTLWTKRLNTVNGGVFNAAGQPAVVDTIDNTSNAAQWQVFDVRSGAVTLQIAPRLTGERGRDVRADVNDAYMLSPDGRFLYVVAGGSRAAVWKFDARSGEQIWAYEDGAGGGTALLPFIGALPYPVTNNALFVVENSSEATVVRIDANTGEASRIFSQDRVEIRAALAGDDILVISAQPTFDRSKTELWGLDTETGGRAWQMRLNTRHAFDDWALESYNGRLFLAQTQWEEGRALFDALDPRTGVSAGQISVPIARADLNGAAFGQGVAWLNISNRLHEVSMSDGQVRSTWP